MPHGHEDANGVRQLGGWLEWLEMACHGLLGGLGLPTYPLTN